MSDEANYGAHRSSLIAARFCDGCDRWVTRRALSAVDVVLELRRVARTTTNDDMNDRRELWAALVRLAIVLSLAGGLLAIFLDTIGDVSTTGLVAMVAIVGFVISWTTTGRFARTQHAPNLRHHPVG